METEFHADLDTFARRYLISSAKRLDAIVPCVPCGEEDYFQDLQFNLLQRQPRFDPAKATWTTFVKLVTDHRTIELRHRCLRGRCNATIAVAQIPDSGGWKTATTEQAHESKSMRLDIADWIKSLDIDEQKLCRTLMRKSVSEAARELGFPRTTVIDKISRLRKRHERTSLKDYAPRTELFRQAVKSDQ